MTTLHYMGTEKRSQRAFRSRIGYWQALADHPGGGCAEVLYTEGSMGGGTVAVPLLTSTQWVRQAG